MFLQEDEGTMCQAHKSQIPPVLPWGHAEMGDKLLGCLLSSGHLGICQGHSYH